MPEAGIPGAEAIVCCSIDYVHSSFATQTYLVLY
jgi:hypothetical protein